MLRFTAWCIQWTLATVFFLLVMTGAGYYVFMEALDGGLQVKTPQIVGLPITEASHLLKSEGLEMGEQIQVYHPTIPKYHVIAQRPTVGHVVRTGHKIIPTVSLGTDFLLAPDLRRKTLREARQEIMRSRFRPGTVARITDKTPRDTVLAQDPEPGTSIANQGEFHLLVSAGSGKRRDFMPDIRGLDIETARRVLAPFNALMVPNEVDFEGAREDVVLNQDPPPNTLIYEGRLVTYDVKPSGSVVLPDSQYRAVVTHTMLYDWFDRDVRVDVVDRLGGRRNLRTLPPLYDNISKRRRAAGSSLQINVPYVGEATVVIYVDGAVAESYFLEGGAPPVGSSNIN
jgi:beta-lactam-binding protein with PASTA domain